MSLELDESLPPEVYPLAWLIGTWQGAGTIGYEGIEPANITSRLVFTNDGGPYLTYSAVTWRLEGALGEDDEADGQTPWHTESGFWRVPPGQTDDAGAPRAEPPFEVEVLLADPAGYVTVFLGEVDGPRASLASDLIARTSNGAEVSGARRLYGLVEGDLLWAWDIAAFSNPLASYLAARLKRRR